MEIGDIGQRAVELSADRVQGLPGIPLVAGFANADDRQKPCTLGHFRLRPHGCIGLAVMLPALGMADNDSGCAGVLKHFRRNVAGECA